MDINYFLKRIMLLSLSVILLSCGSPSPTSAPAPAPSVSIDESGNDSNPSDSDSSSNDSNPIDRRSILKNIKEWMYQIQELSSPNSIPALADTSYPMLVLEPTNNIVGETGFDVAGMLNTLRTTSSGIKRLLLAYVDIGQAEDYRTYWESNWVAPTETQGGTPDFLVTIDPDGWSGNYPVAYWDVRWQNLWLGDNGIITQLANLGFDGIYLDWVEAYDDDKIINKANDDGVHAANEMVLFISKLRDAGRKITPDFLVIAQNAPYLLDDATSDYASVIDALAVEDTWFSGEGDAEWDGPGTGDIPNLNTGRHATGNLITQYKKYIAKELPVFTIDYSANQNNALQVYKDSRLNGFIPLVSRVALSRLTETPPPSTQ